MLKKISHLFLAVLFIAFVVIIGLLPFFVLYGFARMVYFLLYKVFKYRYRVITQNLKLAGVFSEEDKTKVLIRDIYSNLAQILVEGLKSFIMTRNQVIKRHKLINREVFDTYYQQQQSIILVTGHVANWEWGSLSAGLYTDYKVVAFYKPLSNKIVDRFMRWSRARFGTTLASIAQTSKTFEDYQETPTVFLMAADQSPSKPTQAIWLDFMGQKTAFLHGPEKHARNNNYPVLFADIRRVRKGYYELELSLIADNPQALPPDEITRRYAEKLEKVLHERPADWLWSHRRWKLSL